MNTQRLPYTVVLSHVHFDHIGGAFSFCNKNGTVLGNNVSSIIMSNAAITFSKNIDLCSLCTSHGMTVKPFLVSDWCVDKTRLHLGPNKKKADVLHDYDDIVEILFCPGHTPDSIAVYSYGLNRLFVGDTLYPYTAIDNASVGNNVVHYAESMQMLKQYLCAEVPRNKSNGFQEFQEFQEDNNKMSASDSVESFGLDEHVTTTKALIAALDHLASSSSDALSLLGTKKEFVAAVKTHKELYFGGTGNDKVWTREVARSFRAAMQKFPVPVPLTPTTQHTMRQLSSSSSSSLSSSSSSSPTTNPSSGKRKAVDAPTVDLTMDNKVHASEEIDLTSDDNVTQESSLVLTLENCGTNLSCGHVEENLPAQSIETILNILTFIRLGALQPTSIEDDVATYSSGQFHLVLPCNCVEALNK